MEVHPNHQRKGYGERVLNELEARLRERGFNRVVLETNSRLIAAQRLYEGRGFEKVNRAEGPELGGELITYRKEI